jgi:hypothetical protein
MIQYPLVKYSQTMSVRSGTPRKLQHEQPGTNVRWNTENGLHSSRIETSFTFIIPCYTHLKSFPKIQCIFRELKHSIIFYRNRQYVYVQ